MLILFSLPTYQAAAEGIVNIESDEETNVSIVQYQTNISGIKELTPKKTMNLLKSNKSYYLYIGFQECPYCREFSKTLNTFKYEAKLPIYYLNLSKDYSILSEKEKEKLQDFLLRDVELSGTPTFLKVQKHKITSQFVGSETNITMLRSINYK